MCVVQRTFQTQKRPCAVRAGKRPSTQCTRGADSGGRPERDTACVSVCGLPELPSLCVRVGKIIFKLDPERASTVWFPALEQPILLSEPSGKMLRGRPSCA